jgi:hypothetical protein
VVTIEEGADRVVEVLLWQSDRPTRNFVLTLNWRSSVITASPDGKYYASVPQPSDGFIGFMVEVRFSSGAGSGPFDLVKLTTITSVTPNIYEHPPCQQECNCGAPENCEAKGLTYQHAMEISVIN